MNINPQIFKAYDIRGIYPTDINEHLAYWIGVAYAATVKPQGEVLVGADIRLHSNDLKQSLIEGLTDMGVDVVDVGDITTDMYYYGVGSLSTAGGIQVTASHNPKEWHGFKMVKAGPVAMSHEDGLKELQTYVVSREINDNSKVVSTRKGVIRKLDLWPQFVDYCLKYLEGVDVAPMKIVINPNFGLTGKVFEQIVKKGNLPIDIIPLNNEPNGNFPKGRPDPFIEENRVEISELVKTSSADLGIAWDADGDRVFFVADGGQFLDPYHLNPVLIGQMLEDFPGSKVIYDPRYTWALIDAINSNGGIPIICVVGHSYIKQRMREENALFATESSGHTYFRDFWYADSGIIPALLVMKYLSTKKVQLSTITKPIMDKYPISGEINSEIEDKQGKIDEIAKLYSDGEQSRLDGLAVEYSDWRFCVRASNTEPLLRLTLEAKTKDLVKNKTAELLSVIRNSK